MEKIVFSSKREIVACCKNFLVFGVVVGLILPISITFMIFPWLLDYKISSVPSPLILFAASVPTLAVTYAIFSFAEEKDFRGRLTLYIAGFITILLLCAMVFFTGGAKISIFSFSLFFIPSAVAITFDASFGIAMSCFMGAGALGTTIFYFEKLTIEPDSSKTFYDFQLYDLLYLSMIIFQFIAIFSLEWNSRKIKNE